MSDQRLKNKVCIVTGAASGIGEGIAVLFAEHGAQVVIADINAENGTKVAARIEAAGHKAIFIRADLSRDEDCKELINGTVCLLGGVDVLVNNAAAVEEALERDEGDVASLSPESWDYQMRVNLRAVYYLSHLAIPHLKQRGGGTIVNTSSVASMVGWPGAAAYLASKGAINQLTRSMAIDYAADRIRVNAFCPGWINTAPEERRNREAPDRVERTVECMGIQRLGTPSEMAYVALFLACEESSYVTGSVLVADGGWTLR